MCGGGGGGDVFQSIGDTLASVDPGPAIGDVGASIDQAVNQVPGGWYTVGALGAGGAGIAFAPEIAAAAGIGADTAITSELGQQAFFDALANGAASTDAINAGLAADAAAATTTGVGAGTYVTPELMGPTYGELGVTGVPEGGMGPTYAEMGYTGLNQQAAIDAANAASGGLTAKDVLNGLSTANQVKNLATTGYNLINGPAASTVKTGLGMLSGAGATAAGAGAGGSGSGYTESMVNLTPGLTKANENYTLAGMPTISENVMHAASGGSSSLFDDKGNYNYNNSSDTPLTPKLTKHNVGYVLAGLPTLNKAQGGSIHPEFYSEGGASMANRYVKGRGDGTSDSIPAMLANGEFVIPADVVSGLGNGSNDSGAKVLDEFLSTIRQHKQKHKTNKLPPDSKGALSYLTDAKRKVKA